jgi:hypothetical protein|nr:MAG TPA: hydrogenase/urease nickel incorporation protein [Caudoviricetes sp.]
MDRLTKRGPDGQAMMDCEKCKADWTGKHGKPMADCTALYCRNRLKDRIAAYEDSGCAPEEVLPKDKADEIALKLMRLADVVHGCFEPCFDENGNWRQGFAKCSNCGKEYYAQVINHFGFCPNCGAKMDGGVSDEAD